MTSDDKRDVFIVVYTETCSPREIIKRFNGDHSHMIRNLQNNCTLFRERMFNENDNITELDLETDMNYLHTKIIYRWVSKGVGATIPRRFPVSKERETPR